MRVLAAAAVCLFFTAGFAQLPQPGGPTQPGVAGSNQPLQQSAPVDPQPGVAPPIAGPDMPPPAATTKRRHGKARRSDRRPADAGLMPSPPAPGEPGAPPRDADRRPTPPPAPGDRLGQVPPPAAGGPLRANDNRRGQVPPPPPTGTRSGQTPLAAPADGAPDASPTPPPSPADGPQAPPAPAPLNR
ncbi:MAG: hypothetical protein ACRYF4_01235 [Janthinobacterium lividum]